MIIDTLAALIVIISGVTFPADSFLTIMYNFDVNNYTQEWNGITVLPENIDSCEKVYFKEEFGKDTDIDVLWKLFRDLRVERIVTNQLIRALNKGEKINPKLLVAHPDTFEFSKLGSIVSTEQKKGYNPKTAEAIPIKK